jgi:hypothetical protein
VSDDKDNPWAKVDAWAYDHGLPSWYRDYGRKILHQHLKESLNRRKWMATRAMVMFDGLETLMKPVAIKQMMERQWKVAFEVSITTTGEMQLLIKVPPELKNGREIAPAMEFKRIIRREIRISVIDAADVA